MSDLEEQIATHLDTLGVRLDPGIVWDAIPFSFVVDWVVDVSAFLHSFARNNYPIRVVDGGFVHSYKYAYETYTVCWFEEQSYGLNLGTFHGPTTADPIFVSDPFSLGYGPFPAYHGVRSFYNRVKASPSTSTIAARRPTLKQAALSGSLLLSRIRGLNSQKYHFRPRG
jgi:hypothetical protein